MAYSDRHLYMSENLDLTNITADIVIFAPLNRIQVHKVAIWIGTAGTDGLVTVTFQKTVGGTAGTDTTIAAVIVDERAANANQDAGDIVYAEVTTPIIINPGDKVNLNVPAETSGTAPAVTRALLEYSILDVDLDEVSTAIQTA